MTKIFNLVVTSVISINSLGTMDVTTKFHGNPSNRYFGLVQIGQSSAAAAAAG